LYEYGIIKFDMWYGIMVWLDMVE